MEAARSQTIGERRLALSSPPFQRMVVRSMKRTVQREV